MSSALSEEEFVCERVRVAAERIHSRFEETIDRFEEELEHQRRLLDIGKNPGIQPDKITLPRYFLSEHGDSWLQKKSSRVRQEERNRPVGREQQGELYIIEEQPPDTDHFVLNSAHKVNEQSKGELISRQVLTQHLNITASQDHRKSHYKALSIVDEETTDSDHTDESNRGHVKGGDSHASLDHQSWTEFKRNLYIQRFVNTEKQCSEKERYIVKAGRKNTTVQKWKVIMETQLDAEQPAIEECEQNHLDMRSGTSTREKSYSCTVCGKGFSSDWNLKSHMKRHTGEKPFLCTECGKCFGHMSNLKTHMRTHTGEKPFSCTECVRRFSQRASLKSHMSVHTGDKPFPCPVCGKRFSQKSHLKPHMVHHGAELEKPFSCAKCGKSFSRFFYLKSHMMDHSGEKPFSCTECDKSFGRKSNLKCHMRTHTGEKPYFCGDCGQRFSMRSILTKHRRTHTGEKPYRCTECDKDFRVISSLRSHMRTHTGEKPFSCKECGQSFTWRHNLVSHMKSHSL